MGAARLRITAFPIIGTGQDARAWPVAQSAAGFRVALLSTSDTVEALIDGKEPKSSNDQSIPRFTWWDHRGSAEWVRVCFFQAAQGLGRGGLLV